MEKAGDRRAEQRLTYRWPVRFSRDVKKKPFPGQIVNVSSKGLSILCHADGNCPALDQVVTVDFSVPHFDSADSFDAVFFSRIGHVCRVDNLSSMVNRVAFQFAEPLFFKPGEQGISESDAQKRLEAKARLITKAEEKANFYGEAFAMAEERIKSYAKAESEAEEREKAYIEAIAGAEERIKSYAKAKSEAEKREKAYIEAVARAEERIKSYAKAKSEAEKREKAYIEAIARAEERIKFYAEAKAEAEKKLKAEIEARCKAEADVRVEAEQRAKAEAKATTESKLRAKAQKKANTEAQKRIELERARLEAEAKEKIKSYADRIAKIKAESDEAVAKVKAKAADTIAKVRDQFKQKDDAHAKAKIVAVKKPKVKSKNKQSAKATLMEKVDEIITDRNRVF